MNKVKVKVKVKRNNVLKTALGLVIIIGIFSLGMLVASWPERVDAEVNIFNFREENQKHYSNMVVLPVASYATKDKKERQEVIIVDFNTSYKGSKEHIVQCNGLASCDTPEGRTLMPINEIEDKDEREYYLSFFE